MQLAERTVAVMFFVPLYSCFEIRCDAAVGVDDSRAEAERLVDARGPCDGDRSEATRFFDLFDKERDQWDIAHFDLGPFVKRGQGMEVGTCLREVARRVVATSHNGNRDPFHFLYFTRF